MFATSAAVKALARREAAIRYNVRTMASLAAYEDFGKNVFMGTVADEYLKKHGTSGEILKNANWVKTDSDKVANAVFDWYVVKFKLVGGDYFWKRFSSTVYDEDF
jgi:glutamine synthetase